MEVEFLIWSSVFPYRQPAWLKWWLWPFAPLGNIHMNEHGQYRLRCLVSPRHPWVREVHWWGACASLDSFPTLLWPGWPLSVAAILPPRSHLFPPLPNPTPLLRLRRVETRRRHRRRRWRHVRPGSAGRPQPTPVQWQSGDVGGGAPLRPAGAPSSPRRRGGRCSEDSRGGRCSAEAGGGRPRPLEDVPQPAAGGGPLPGPPAARRCRWGVGWGAHRADVTQGPGTGAPHTDALSEVRLGGRGSESEESGAGRTRGTARAVPPAKCQRWGEADIYLRMHYIYICLI